MPLGVECHNVEEKGIQEGPRSVKESGSIGGDRPKANKLTCKRLMTKDSGSQRKRSLFRKDNLVHLQPNISEASQDSTYLSQTSLNHTPEPSLTSERAEVTNDVQFATVAAANGTADVEPEQVQLEDVETLGTYDNLGWILEDDIFRDLELRPTAGAAQHLVQVQHVSGPQLESPSADQVINIEDWNEPVEDKLVFLHRDEEVNDLSDLDIRQTASVHQNVEEEHRHVPESSRHIITDQEVAADVEDWNETVDNEHMLLQNRDEEVNDYSDFDFDLEFSKKEFELKVGHKFANAAKFREALVEWNVKKGYGVHYHKNEGTKVTAVCAKGCSWRIHGSVMCNDSTFMIKTLKGEHSCPREFTNKHCNSRYISKKYKTHFKDNPNCSVQSVKNQVKRDLMVDLSKKQVYKEKNKAREDSQGMDNIQYAQLWDYAEMIRRINPGSEVRIKNVVVDETSPPKFQRMFVCFNAWRLGFVNGCRPIIGLDACHLKGNFKGQLLSAVGRDGNDNMFVIAVCVAEAENNSSWKWFLEHLSECIGQRTDGLNYTIISDRQKGLVHAVNTVFPSCEQRFCVRHMWKNFKGKYSGKDISDLLWSAARSSHPSDFNWHMEALSAINEAAATWLKNIYAHLWSKAFFSFNSKCDTLLNNLSESFNSSIEEARELPIIHMLENIRKRTMAKINCKRSGIQSCQGVICPNILTRLEQIKINSRGCIALMSDRKIFEVTDGYGAYVVNLETHECTCRMFQLNGYPCVDAASAIQVERSSIVDYVHHFYSKNLYVQTYAPVLYPILSASYWEHTGLVPINPPDVKKQTGRPKKQRKKGADEPKNHEKTTRKGTANHCTQCLQKGHNKRSCKNAIHPSSKLNKRPRVGEGAISSREAAAQASHQDSGTAAA